MSALPAIRVPDADDDVSARVERARRYEREAVAHLQQVIRRSEEFYAQAARILARFEASLEARRATLARLGYLVERRLPHQRA
jgi:hypothetical protein